MRLKERCLYYIVCYVNEAATLPRWRFCSSIIMRQRQLLVLPGGHLTAYVQMEVRGLAQMIWVVWPGGMSCHLKPGFGFHLPVRGKPERRA